MKYKVRELYALEQLSGGGSPVHKLHRAVKLVVTLVFIITVMSFDRYSLTRLAPFIFYPVIMAALSGTPFGMLFKRFLIALPFCFFAGVTNIFFTANLTLGVISFFTILFKAYLCVTAVMIFIAVTPFADITASLRRARVPYIFVAVFEMTYRYIGVLFDEAYSMYTAYSLRSADKKGIAMRDMGVFAGQLLLRSIDRAERVYGAMKCRGYELRGLRPGGLRPGGSLNARDIIFCAAVCLSCIVLRGGLI